MVLHHIIEDEQQVIAALFSRGKHTLGKLKGNPREKLVGYDYFGRRKDSAEDESSPPTVKKAARSRSSGLNASKAFRELFFKRPTYIALLLGSSFRN